MVSSLRHSIRRRRRLVSAQTPAQSLSADPCRPTGSCGLPSTRHVEQLGAVAKHCELTRRLRPRGTQPSSRSCCQVRTASLPAGNALQCHAWNAQAGPLPLRRTSLRSLHGAQHPAWNAPSATPDALPAVSLQSSTPASTPLNATHGALRRPSTRYQQVPCHSLGPCKPSAPASMSLNTPHGELRRPTRRSPATPWVPATFCAGLHAPQRPRICPSMPSMPSMP